MKRTQARLFAAGFKVIRAYPGQRWFHCTSPDGEEGALLRQSESAWHWFARYVASTYSSCNLERAHLDGLGDALGTESQFRTYCRLLQPENIPEALQQFEGVYAAMGQVYAEMQQTR